MKHDNENSARNSGATSKNEPGHKESPTHGLSESAYLEAQATHAKAAIASTISDIKSDLVHAVDPRLWTKDHPWASLMVAAAGGFAAACAAVPTKEDQALHKLEKLEEALFGAAKKRKTAEAEGEDYARDGKKKSEKPGFMGTLVKELIGVIKPLLTSALAAGVSAKVAQPESNGQTTAQGAGMGAGFGEDDGGGEQ